MSDQAIPAEFAPLAAVAAFYKSEADAANALASQIIAARKKPEDAVDAILATSSDDKVVAWRAADEDADKKIKALQEARAENRKRAIAYAAANLLPTADENFNVDAAREAFIAKRKQVDQMHGTLRAYVGSDENMARLMDVFGIVEVTSLSARGGQSSRGATGIRRPRISEATFDGVNVEKDGKASFTLLTAHVKKVAGKVDADVIRQAAFAAAGTEDLSSLPSGTVVNFSLVIDGKTHAVSVTTVGRTAEDETEDENAEDETEATETE